MMAPSKKEIAVLFSNGQFDEVVDYISDGVVWNVVGENSFHGKNEVLANCEQTADYFKSVQTDFKTDEVVASGNKVFVIGTAEFKRDGKRLNFIAACDVYDFNDKNEIERISSYCIPENKA